MRPLDADASSAVPIGEGGVTLPEDGGGGGGGGVQQQTAEARAPRWGPK